MLLRIVKIEYLEIFKLNHLSGQFLPTAPNGTEGAVNRFISWRSRQLTIYQDRPRTGQVILLFDGSAPQDLNNL